MVENLNDLEIDIDTFATSVKAEMTRLQNENLNLKVANAQLVKNINSLKAELDQIVKAKTKPLSEEYEAERTV